MGHYYLDNGEWMMRAQREYEAQQQDQKPEPEDTTGLKMLDEFLHKRKEARDG